MATGTTSEILLKLTRIETLLAGQQPQPLTLPQAAIYLNVSKQTLYRWTSQSEIVHYKPSGKNIYFLKGDLDNWLTRRRVAEVER